MKTIKSIDKAITILNSFKEQEYLGIRDLEKITSYSKSTVFDIVNTLLLQGFLEQHAETKKYRLGLGLFELGSLYKSRNSLTKSASVYCDELSKKYQATVHLTIPDQGQVVYIGKYEDANSMVRASSIGKRLPMSCTGVGKAMLAFLGDDYADTYVFSKDLPSYTPNSITSASVLEKELKEIKKRGYAIDNEEIALGLRCVAAPIFKGKREVLGAVSVSLLSPNLKEEDIEGISMDVKRVASLLSE